MSGYYWAAAALMAVGVLWDIGRPAHVEAYDIQPWHRILVVLASVGVLALLVIGALRL